ncbi:hypothetical protein BCR43DRAFT_548936 [Syncephalastrum racemosum]|uniref:6-methylsalicylate decarboxylase n=1 Tax=Syncephalastrum racemosum TaxID=13706 RepID=A0A1X2HAN9_SYNRA|nr:hypothetical protein BCR43DRAFT_548936 [Syncephalastrum racemosum]
MTDTYIDTHLHVITPAYEAAVEASGGDPSGYPMPTWTEDGCLDLMNKLRVKQAVLSVTAPGPAVAGNGPEGRKLARKVNEEVGAMVKREPRFKFFASTPDWTDLQGTLDEIDYIFGHTEAAGVVIMTAYQDRLLGDDLFKPIWAKLNEHKAIVFIHPSTTTLKPQFIADNLPNPLIDYPHNTTRTAVDILLKGRVRDNPDLDIILSHGGGSMPYVVARVIALLRDGNFPAAVTLDEFEQGWNKFYMDLALATSWPQLEAMLALGAERRLIFGSDYPYAPPASSIDFGKKLDDFVAHHPNGHRITPEVLTRNAMELFKKHNITL